MGDFLKRLKTSIKIGLKQLTIIIYCAFKYLAGVVVILYLGLAPSERSFLCDAISSNGHCPVIDTIGTIIGIIAVIINVPLLIFLWWLEISGHFDSSDDDWLKMNLKHFFKEELRAFAELASNLFVTVLHIFISPFILLAQLFTRKDSKKKEKEQEAEKEGVDEDDFLLEINDKTDYSKYYTGFADEVHYLNYICDIIDSLDEEDALAKDLQKTFKIPSKKKRETKDMERLERFRFVLERTLLDKGLKKSAKKVILVNLFKLYNYNISED